MEKSIKRVEKLVHATNSALAQMKFNLMFDDMREDLVGKCRNGKNLEQPTTFGDGFLDGGDLRFCQDEFKAEANEMLAKMETMFKSSDLPRKNSRAVDRIKEINEKLNNRRLELSKPTETEESRQKLLSLLSEEKFSPKRISPGKEYFRSKLPVLKKYQEKPPPELRKSDSTTTIIVTPATAKPKEELREKILETQEIVNRGFQTARELSEKVESITKCDRKEKTPSSVKTASDLRSSDGKTESNETIHSVKCRRCAKEKRRKKDVEKIEEVNAKVIEVRRNDSEGSKRPNLQFQRLPSLHIKGGLQLQRVHNLEIPAGGDAVCQRSNTAVMFLSHEEMEKEKMKEIVEKVRKENCCCVGDDPRWNYIECFNCGKLIRIRGTRADPRKVDEILQKCNYNVFDPRIDEFAEKCGAVAALDLPEKPEPPPEPAPSTPKKPEDDKDKAKTKENSPKRVRRQKIQHLSNQLIRKYKEEADTIEGNHLKLDSILQNLFRKVDESREVFEECRLLRNRRSDSGRAPVLTTTKPVLVSLIGTSFKSRRRQRKLDASRRRTDSQDIKTEAERELHAEKTHGISSVVYTVSSENAKAEETKQPDVGKEEERASVSSSSSSSSTSKSGSSVRGRKESIQLRIVKELDWIAKKEETERRLFLSSTANKPTEARQEETERETTPSSIKTAEHDRTQDKPKETESPAIAEEKQPSETSSDNNYESDFESMTNEPEEIGDEDEEPEMNPRADKLSTISEVDSELEKKLSDELKSSRNGSENKQKEEISTGSKKTDTTPQKTETSMKSTPTELVTSLKDILSALKDQFARTETLAEKLTENAKTEKKEKPELDLPFTGDAMLNSWRMPDGAKLVENLQSARKDLPKSPKIHLGGGKSGESVSEEGGSSLGEIVLSERKRKTSGKSESSCVSESSFLKLSSGKQGGHILSGSKLELDSEDMLYSEGEIPSDELLPYEPSQMGSVGEVLSGKNSVASLE